MRSLVALLLALTLWYGEATAGVCKSSNVLRRELIGRHGEVEVYRAVTTLNLLIEFFVNPKTSTWSEVVTYPNGISCLVRAGDGWGGPTIVRIERHAQAG